MRVLVTDGDNRAALAVTRSLGRAGHEVIVGERHSPSLAETSRYCAGGIVYPNPVSAPDAFVDELAELVRRHEIEALVPVADITTLLITGHRVRFGGCAIPFADAGVIERAADKVEMVQAAMRLGVPVPRTFVVSDPEQVPDIDLDYPVVIKPHRSRVRLAGNGWASSSVSYARDRDALTRDLMGRPNHEFPVMLQERIVGPGLGVFAFYHDGRPVALFSHRRVRERPPWGGVSVLSESVPLCPHAGAYATRLLDDLGWQGVAMVEFKRDLRDDQPKLMEINGRFWGSLQLAVDAGVDFPALLLQGINAARFEPQGAYRTGVRNRWLWGDLDSLMLSLRGNGGPGTGSVTSRPRAVLDFMKFWGRDLHYDNPKLHDPRPWFFETGKRLRMAARHTLTRPSRGEAEGGTPSMPHATGRARKTLRAEIVSSLDAVGLDAAQWNALAARSGTNSVFQTYEWTRSWWRVFGDKYDPLFVKVSRPSGVAGIAPLIVEQRTGQRVVRFLGDGRADYCDFLGSADSPAVLEAVFGAICDYHHWDVIELNNVPSESRSLDVMRGICERAGYRTLTHDHFVCPTLIIEGHAEEAHQVWNKASLRRRENYFQRAGRLVCRNLPSAEVASYLDRFFAQHITRWSGNGSPSLFVNGRNKEFYRELTANLAGTGWLLFSVVEFNDRPIAFHYGFDYNGTVVWYKPSFDTEYEQHSPGLVMVRHLIGYAIDHRRRELDFTVGDEPFKRRFTNLSRKTVRMQIFQNHTRYLLQRSQRELITAVKRFAR